MRYRRSGDVTWELVDDRAVILDPGGSTLTTLNPIGTLVWQHLDQPREATELGEHLARRFPEVDRHQLESDAGSFLDRLARDGLVVELAA